MVIRTVFDARPKVGHKHLYHLLLLAASWHANIRDKRRFPLEVICVGKAHSGLVRYLEQLNISLVLASPHEHDAFSPYSNKILGIAEPSSDRKVLLVDNDVFFLGDPDDLGNGNPGLVAAAIAGSDSVTPKHWDLIREKLGLSPRLAGWTPIVKEWKALLGGSNIPVVPLLFCNSGVVLSPAGADFASLWSEDVKRIADLFANHPLRLPFVYGHDQAGFATACGRYKNFTLLPLRFNYRPPCFWLGKENVENICIMHLTSFYNSAKRFPLDIDREVSIYWNMRVISKILDIKHAIPASELHSRIKSAETCLLKIRSVINEYNLTELAQVCLKGK